MVLGVYWYYGFPEGLYTYNYFTFRKGLGGHADAPAELFANVRMSDADVIVTELKALLAQYPLAFIYIYKSANDLQIATGGYSMHDYDFELALKMDAILERHAARSVGALDLKNAELIRLCNDKEPDAARLTKKYFQLVASSLKNKNAETAMIRFDCHVQEDKKEDFFAAIKSVAETANLHVVFYLEKQYNDYHNLMLFFTNGRQGVALGLKQQVDVFAFEDAMDAVIHAFGIQFGHAGGWDYYPKGEYKVLKIVDAEFIL